jgi:hypothetical protein
LGERRVLLLPLPLQTVGEGQHKVSNMDAREGERREMEREKSKL